MFSYQFLVMRKSCASNIALSLKRFFIGELYRRLLIDHVWFWSRSGFRHVGSSQETLFKFVYKVSTPKHKFSNRIWFYSFPFARFVRTDVDTYSYH
ncbi:hypothetical protein D917_06240 [Trichinella nativa]|uniref:Uncharacterized protein n=1 Tax=Trichinella nativa TaxID=6335 RepID=A0A1Y3EU62_9BILA|nr:hypothetical protein D917_06240 [Trichinella nativa]